MNSSELRVGTRIDGRYVLKEFKGRGSFGEVWLAEDEVLGIDLAIKFYLILDEKGQEEFKEEYKITSNLIHQNLLTTKYYSVWNNRPYLTMKYCPNGSASDRCGEVPEGEAWRFIHDVASGLSYLHAQNPPIIHQDIKPENILVDEMGTYLITDFGISKKLRSTMRKQSKRNVGAGTIPYMGPEHFTAQPLTVKASDIWSLGVSVYELVTGELPFMGQGGAMLNAGAEIPYVDANYSVQLNDLVRRCLAKDTWERPTAEQLVRYTDAVLNGCPDTFGKWLDSVQSAGHSKEVSPLAKTVELKEKEKGGTKGLAIMAGAAAVIFIGVILSFFLSSTPKYSDYDMEAADTVVVEVVEEIEKTDVVSDTLADITKNVKGVAVDRKESYPKESSQKNKERKSSPIDDSESLLLTTVNSQPDKQNQKNDTKSQEDNQAWKASLLIKIANMQVPEELHGYKARLVDQINTKDSSEDKCVENLNRLKVRVIYYNRLMAYKGKLNEQGLPAFKTILNAITNPNSGYNPKQWDKGFAGLNKYVLPEHREERALY